MDIYSHSSGENPVSGGFHTSLTIQDVMDRWPQTIPVFLKHRLTCVGCSMAGFGTLDEAIRLHGISAAPFLAELRQAVGEDGYNGG
jgi:hybrid cluster-associated redox disulfide protein